MFKIFLYIFSAFPYCIVTSVAQARSDKFLSFHFVSYIWASKLFKMSVNISSCPFSSNGGFLLLGVGVSGKSCKYVKHCKTCQSDDLKSNFKEFTPHSNGIENYLMGVVHIMWCKTCDVIFINYEQTSFIGIATIFGSLMLIILNNIYLKHIKYASTLPTQNCMYYQ